MTALIKSRLSPNVFRSCILTGMRIGGVEAKELGIVDEAVFAEQVLPRAMARASSMANKGRDIYRSLKRGMYAEAIALLETGAVNFP
jgi:enoyl-CoA hydratase/carnithine racemase